MHIELPSRYIPYNFKTVTLLPFSPMCIPPMSRSVENDDLQPLLDAVDRCIDVDVNQLTEGDFYYVLTMMRLHAFKRNPLVARWTCNGGMVFRRMDTNEIWTEEEMNAYVKMWHEAEDREGMVDPDTIQVEPELCNHHNEENVTDENLIVHYLPDPQEKPFQLEPRLDFPRARLIPEAYELSDDEEFGPMVRVAKWVRAGDTLIEKIELVSQDMDLYEAALEAERTYRHGVTKYVVKTCRACGNDNTLQMEVSAMSFL